MSRRRWIIEGDLDDAALKSHVSDTGGNSYPLVDDPTEFTWDDLKAAFDDLLVENIEVVAGTGGEV